MLATRIEEVYARLRLGREVPEEPPFTEADARNLVNPLRRALRRAGHSPPPPCVSHPVPWTQVCLMRRA